MIVAWNANVLLDNPGTTGKLESSAGAFLAGCVLILIINMLQHIYCERQSPAILTWHFCTLHALFPSRLVQSLLRDRHAGSLRHACAPCMRVEAWSCGFPDQHLPDHSVSPTAQLSAMAAGGMTDNGTAPVQFGRKTEAAAGDEVGSAALHRLHACPKLCRSALARAGPDISVAATNCCSLEGSHRLCHPMCPAFHAGQGRTWLHPLLCHSEPRQAYRDGLSMLPGSRSYHMPFSRHPSLAMRSALEPPATHGLPGIPASTLILQSNDYQSFQQLRPLFRPACLCEMPGSPPADTLACDNRVLLYASSIHPPCRTCTPASRRH